jgi:hypothetical protein
LRLKLLTPDRGMSNSIFNTVADIVAVMGFFLAMMIYALARNMMTGWDFAILIVGAVSALLAGGAM